MKQILVFTFLLLSILSRMQAQDDDELVNLDSLYPIDPYYYQLAANNCHVPQVEGLAVIQYNGYSKAFISLKGEVFSPNVQYRLKESSEAFTETSLDNGKIVLNSLLPNQNYIIKLVPTPTSISGGNNTRTWDWLNNKGAAKWH
jgi:hypothetical protein